MQGVHLHWNRSKMLGTGFDELLVPCSRLEVVAHLALSETGVRQLVRCDFRDGFGPEDLSNSELDYSEVLLEAEEILTFEEMKKLFI